jgi:hypothetical protein
MMSQAHTEEMLVEHTEEMLVEHTEEMLVEREGCEMWVLPAVPKGCSGQ